MRRPPTHRAGSDCSCAGFSDAGAWRLPRLAAVSGVGEAPRHEIACCGFETVQRALWGLRISADTEVRRGRRTGWLYRGGTRRFPCHRPFIVVAEQNAIWPVDAGLIRLAQVSA